MPVFRSELGPSHSPETKSIQALTKEDMRRIARITKGGFRDNSKTFPWELGEAYWSKKHPSVSLILYVDGKNETLIRLTGPKTDDIFSKPSTIITLNEDRVTIQNANSKLACPSPILTIEQGNISYFTPRSPQIDAIELLKINKRSSFAHTWTS